MLELENGNHHFRFYNKYLDVIDKGKKAEDNVFQ